MPYPASILCFGNDAILAKTRQQIFQGAGFASQMASNVEELHSCFHNHVVDVLIICHSAIAVDCEAAKHLAHRQAIPPLVLILHTGFKKAANDEEAGFDSRQGPQRLIAAVNALIHDNGWVCH